MIDFLDFVPRKPRGVFDRLLEARLRLAARDDVKPIAITAVFGDAAFIGSQKHSTRRGADAFDFYQAQLTGVEIEAGDVVAEVLLVNIINLAAPSGFVVHYDPHGYAFNFRVGLQAADVRLGPFGMRQHQNACDALNRLQCQGALLFELLPPFFSPRHEFGMAVFRLGQPAFGAGDLLLDLRIGFTDLFIGHADLTNLLLQEPRQLMEAERAALSE